MKHLNTMIVMAFLMLAGMSHINGANVQGQDSRGFLGVQSETISPEKAGVLDFDNMYGSYITRVLDNTAAKKVGLAPFDYIYGVNEQRTSRQNTLIDLLLEHQPGDEVTVHFVRNQKKQHVQVVLGQEGDARFSEYGETGRPFLGINRHPDTDDNALGVRVYVVDASTAETMGLQDGDLIMALNGHPMIDWTDISTAIDNMEVGQTLVVQLKRQGQSMKLSDVIKSRRATMGRAGVTSTWTQPEGAFLGVYSSDVSEEKAEKLGFDNSYGSYITGVIGNTAAEKAGIQAFDYIYGVDEFRTGAEQNLSVILRKYRPGDEATIRFIRAQKKQTLPVVLGRRSDARTEKRSECEDPFLGVSQTSNDSPQGVRVNIVENSTAAGIGVPKGAVITHINKYPIIDWTDMGTAIDLLQVGETIIVDYLEKGQKQTATGPIKSYCETKTKTNKLFDWDWNFDFDREDDQDISEDIRRNISGMKISVAPVPGDEATRLRNDYKLNFPNNNDLRAERLNITPQTEKGLFRLRFELPQRGETSVRIYNTSGRQIYEYDLGSFSGEFSDDVDIAQNGPGNYYLLIQQSGQTFSRKVVVN